MPWIEVDNVTVRFPVITGQSMSLKSRMVAVARKSERSGASPGYVTALDDISFALQMGDRLGIVGLNGSGKSTLLRSLTGIYEPTIGEVRVCGKSNALIDLSLGFDMEAIGFENIQLRGYALGMSSTELRTLAPAIAEFSGLGPRLNDPIRTYSAGMLLRLAFTTSLFCPHDILLIDEVIGVGDAPFLAKTQERLLSTVGVSRIVVFASHALDLIRTICNKVLYLRDGRIAAIGPVDDVLNQYSNEALDCS